MNNYDDYCTKLLGKHGCTSEECKYCSVARIIAEHDAELLDKVAEKLKAEMIETYPKNINGVKAPTPFAHFSYRKMCEILDKVIAEMKAEVTENEQIRFEEK